ncbi:DciA family protein [Ancylobacter sp. MQZ15Z-1]|uniref:DciA family protein n=1 Tax=Ancylobacter mangrovi TaxID=2972472 RepID=A0A9X2T5F2_9HYPH|nr:DciA family protein [Ancylobacter mangrovi]MCS0495369.1 DciA family protein [Ancylobacter mangrovi]
MPPKPPGSYVPRSFAPRPLADLVDATISESCRQRGIASVEIVTRWAEIVGDVMAARALPVKLVWPSRPESPEPGVLHVRVEGGYAIELQHLGPVVVERVNRYFGWRCIGRLALRQGPVATRPARPPRPAEPDAAARADIARRLGPFEDPELAAALARLGALVARDRRTPAAPAPSRPLRMRPRR